MRKRLSIAVALLCVVAIGAIGYFRYLGRRLEAITSAPGVAMGAVPFSPVPVSTTKPLDLGYARVSMPGGVEGELVHMGSSNFVCLASANAPILTFCPPTGHQDSDSLSVMKLISDMRGAKVGSWYELEKLELAQKPFSIWQLILMGRKAAAANASLLMMKSTEYSDVTSVRVIENDHIGLIIRTRGTFTSVMVADLRSGVTQDILIAASVKDLDQVITAIFRDYELISTRTDPASVAQLIEGLGLRTISS